jgi:hypothetical protein
MSIGTPVSIADNTSGTAIASGGTISTSVAAPVGSLIVVCIFPNSPDVNVTGVTLSSGDVETGAIHGSAISATNNCALYYFINTAHNLPSGGTIKVTVSSGTWRLAAYAVSGATNGKDGSSIFQFSSGQTSISPATGALASSNEIAFGVVYQTSSITGWTESSGFTTLVNPNVNRSGVSYQILNTNAAITWSASWTGASPVTAVLATFEGTLPSGATIGTASASSASSGVGASVATALAAIAMIGAASGVGSATGVGVGSVSALTVASGVGASMMNATEGAGTSTGSALASGVGLALFSGVGSVGASAVAGAVGRSRAASAGSILATIGALGISPAQYVNGLPWRSRVITNPLIAPQLDDDLMYLLGLSGIVGGTVANLPANVGVGARGFVTDATSATFAATVVGGGANRVPVSYDGSKWIVG